MARARRRPARRWPPTSPRCRSGRRVRRRGRGVRGQPPARPGGRAGRAPPGHPPRRRGARLDVLGRRGRRPRRRWTRWRRRSASSRPSWYADLQERAHGRRRPGLVERALAAAGFARWTVTEEPVDVGLTEPADVVRYRLGMPHLHRFVARLPADARRGVRGRSGRGGAPDRRAGSRRSSSRPSRPPRLTQPARRRPSGTPRRARPPRGPRARPGARPSPGRAPIRSRRPRRRPATSPRARPPPARASRSAVERGPRRPARRAGPARSPGPAGPARRSAASPRSSAAAATGSRRVERGRGVLLGEREPGQRAARGAGRSATCCGTTGRPTRSPRPRARSAAAARSPARSRQSATSRWHWARISWDPASPRPVSASSSAAGSPRLRSSQLR